LIKENHTKTDLTQEVIRVQRCH